jgi:hypothetical protein
VSADPAASSINEINGIAAGTMTSTPVRRVFPPEATRCPRGDDVCARRHAF